LVARGVALIIIAPFLVIAALPALLLIVALKPVLTGANKWRCLTPEIVLYLLCGSALWLAEFHRKDINHLVFGCPLLLLLFVYFLNVNRTKFCEYALQLVAISSLWLATFNLIGVLAARSVRTRAGTVAVFNDYSLLSFVEAHVDAGEEIFVYPYFPSLYFLSGTTNPTRNSILMYNYNTSEQFQEVIGILDRRKVRHVIWETTLMQDTAINFPGSKPPNSNDLIMEPYLESHYRVLSEVHGVRLMERKEEAPGN